MIKNLTKEEKKFLLLNQELSEMTILAHRAAINEMSQESILRTIELLEYVRELHLHRERLLNNLSFLRHKHYKENKL